MNRTVAAFAQKIIVVGLLGLAGCGGTRNDFIGSRVQDLCNESWPVCDTFAGCLVGAESYVGGRFPNEGKLLIQISEPSTVRVSFYLENITASGKQTEITFYEDRCTARVRDEFTGDAFVTQAENNNNVFSQQADLVGIGDHLIEFNSDAQATYTLKIDISPVRTQGN